MDVQQLTTICCNLCNKIMCIETFSAKKASPLSAWRESVKILQFEGSGLYASNPVLPVVSCPRFQRHGTGGWSMHNFVQGKQHLPYDVVHQSQNDHIIKPVTHTINFLIIFMPAITTMSPAWACSATNLIGGHEFHAYGALKNRFLACKNLLRVFCSWVIWSQNNAPSKAAWVISGRLPRSRSIQIPPKAD